MSRFQLNITKKTQRIVIDGDVISRGYCIDYGELVKSAKKEGRYFIFTCGCGEPGCAGIREPIEVEYSETKVFWHITDPEPERWFSFGEDQYRTAIEEGLASILDLLSPHRPDSFIGPYGSTRAGFLSLYDEVKKA